MLDPHPFDFSGKLRKISAKPSNFYAKPRKCKDAAVSLS
jgi:hypothetical protein